MSLPFTLEQSYLVFITYNLTDIAFLFYFHNYGLSPSYIGDALIAPPVSSP